MQCEKYLNTAAVFKYFSHCKYIFLLHKYSNTTVLIDVCTVTLEFKDIDGLTAAVRSATTVLPCIPAGRQNNVVFVTRLTSELTTAARGEVLPLRRAPTTSHVMIAISRLMCTSQSKAGTTAPAVARAFSSTIATAAASRRHQSAPSSLRHSHG